MATMNPEVGLEEAPWPSLEEVSLDGSDLFNTLKPKQKEKQKELKKESQSKLKMAVRLTVRGFENPDSGFHGIDVLGSRV